MSVRMITTVFAWGAGADWTSGRRLVPLALADQANDQGRCWPGIDRIAEKCGLARETAVRHLQTLAKDGWIVIVKRRAAGGMFRTNHYQLTQKLLSPPDDTPSSCQTEPLDETSHGAEPSDVSSPEPCDISANTVWGKSHPNHQLEPSEEPPPPEAGQNGGGGDEEIGEKRKEGRGDRLERLGIRDRFHSIPGRPELSNDQGTRKHPTPGGRPQGGFQ